MVHELFCYYVIDFSFAFLLSRTLSLSLSLLLCYLQAFTFVLNISITVNLWKRSWRTRKIVKRFSDWMYITRQPNPWFNPRIDSWRGVEVLANIRREVKKNYIHGKGKGKHRKRIKESIFKREMNQTGKRNNFFFHRKTHRFWTCSILRLPSPSLQGSLFPSPSQSQSKKLSDSTGKWRK